MTGRRTRRQFLKTVAVASAATAVSGSARASSGKIKIGQIGIGHAHASGKMRSYRNSESFEVVGLVEEDPVLRARAERDPAYRDLPLMTREQLLNVSGLQAVAVETEVKDLLDHAEACVDGQVRGRGAFCYVRPSVATEPDADDRSARLTAEERGTTAFLVPRLLNPLRRLRARTAPTACRGTRTLRGGDHR